MQNKQLHLHNFYKTSHYFNFTYEVLKICYFMINVSRETCVPTVYTFVKSNKYYFPKNILLIAIKKLQLIL